MNLYKEAQLEMICSRAERMSEIVIFLTTFAVVGIVIATCDADSYPVGMDISGDGKKLIVTAQGKSGKGGNSVMIFDVTYNNAK